MRAAGLVKIILLLIGLGAVALIISNILSRSAQQAPAEPPGPLLAPEVESRSTRFEYSEKEEGRTIFSVSAATSTLTKQGLQSLESPRLVLYNQEGGNFDTIEGRRANYRMGEKRIEFLEDVQILLSDKTSIRSSKVEADLERNLVHIDQQFEFERGEANGTGRSLSYQIDTRQLDATRFHMLLPTAAEPVQAWAQHASYDIPQQGIQLKGQARIERAGGLLEADRIDVALTPDQLLQRLISLGKARFSPRSGQIFQGNVIRMRFAPRSGRLLRMEVVGSTAPADSPTRAAFQRQLEGGAERLEADRLEVLPGQGGDGSDFAVQQLTASGLVDFQSEPLRIVSSRSQRFVADFSQDGVDLQQLDLGGGVVLNRQSPASEDQRLSSRQLRLEFLPAQVMRRARAVGNPVLETQGSQMRRRLSALHFIDFDFEDGLLARVEARGGCQVSSHSGEEVRQLRAPSIDLVLRGGNPQQVTAGEGVQAELGAQSTRSRSLQLDYRDGKLFRALQQGDFRLIDPAAGVDLQADEALFDPYADEATVGGVSGLYKLIYSAEPGNPAARPSETLARRFVITRKQGRISALQAHGEVVSRIEGHQDHLSVRAGTMSARPGEGIIEYSQRPTVQQPGLSIVADSVRLRQSDQSLTAKGSVQSSFQDPDRPDSRSFSVTAAELSFEPQSRRAHYQADVRLETQDLKVESPQMEIVLDEASRQVHQVVAWKGVLVHPDERREIRGRRLVYDPSLDEVVITGDPVTMNDPEEGKATSNRLTFKVGSDSLRMGNPPGGNKPPIP